MRTMLIGKKLSIATQVDFSTIADGAIGVYWTNPSTGIITPLSNASAIKGTKNFSIVLGRKGLCPIQVLCNTTNFSYTLSEYVADVKFNASLTVTSPIENGEYTIIILRKGSKDSERYKWTSSVYVASAPMSDSNLAEKLVKDINSKTHLSGLKASASGSSITFTSDTTDDYEILTADKLSNVKPSYTARGLAGQNGEEFIKNLKEFNASEFGFEYPVDDVEDMYKGYRFDAKDFTTDNPPTFTIFNIRFKVPRETSTIDYNVNQLVQIVVPTGSACIDTLKSLFDSIK